MPVSGKYLIIVTEDDIKQGTKKLVTKCPIALAAKRVLLEPVSVTYTHLEIGRGSKALLRYLPKKASTFVDKFDDGKPVKPFKFSITV